MVESEALLQLGHLTGEGRRVCGAAGEDLDCHGTAVAGAEQPIDDLPFAALAVTAVAELGDRTPTTFQVARRRAVERQCAAAEMAFGEGRLDCRLADRQPVECAVELVLVDHPESELLAKAGGRGVRRQRPGGGKLRPGIEDAANGEGQDEVATAIAVWAEQPIEADPARRAEGRVDMTMRQRAQDGNGILVLGNDGAAFEQCPEAGDPLVPPVGKVQQGALLDLARLAVALAQQDGGGRVAIGDRFDIHGSILPTAPSSNNQNPSDYMATFRCHQNKLGGDTNHLMVRKDGCSLYTATPTGLLGARMNLQSL